MRLERSLRRFRQDQFTDSDVTACTGLSQRAWRELIKLRTVRTVTEDRGRGIIRLCDATVFKRAAVIGTVNRAGWSLAVSGQIAYFLPFHTVLYAVCDPSLILLQRSRDLDPKAGLPPRRDRPLLHWFDPGQPAEIEPENDWLLDIYQRQFVGIRYTATAEPLIFGDLRNDGATFVAWRTPLNQRAPDVGPAINAVLQELTPRFIDFIKDWEDPTKWAKELKPLGYKFERHERNGDPLRVAAERAARSPEFLTTINLSLALRKSLRRFLGIEPAVRQSK
jgi:hypothetical protein